MTVKELILKLMEFDQDQKVVLRTRNKSISDNFDVIEYDDCDDCIYIEF